MNIETIREFLGWCATINIGFLVLSSVMILLFGKPISRLHGKMFGLEEERLRQHFYEFLGNFKILVLIFNVAPYLALRIMGA